MPAIIISSFSIRINKSPPMITSLQYYRIICSLFHVTLICTAFKHDFVLTWSRSCRDGLLNAWNFWFDLKKLPMKFQNVHQKLSHVRVHEYLLIFVIMSVFQVLFIETISIICILLSLLHVVAWHSQYKWPFFIIIIIICVIIIIITLLLCCLYHHQLNTISFVHVMYVIIHRLMTFVWETSLGNMTRTESQFCRFSIIIPMLCR